MDINQYSIQSYAMSDLIVMDEGSADVEIRITFGRRVLNQMLTVFLPSFCICLISFSTNYYQA